MADHAILSPSSSNIWLHCAPSALMMSLMPQEETEFTTEGTLAHELAEYKIRKYVLGEESLSDPHDNKENVISPEMEKCTDLYRDYCLEVVEKYENEGFFPEILVETTLDLTSCIPESKGTADLIIIAGDTVKVVDFKYGAFHAVDGNKNTQMMIYAFGAIERCKAYGSFENISMTIFQPRMDNISSCDMTVSELEEWKNKVLIPSALKAIEGEGELVTGDHCSFCRAKLICRAQREKILKNLEELKTMVTEKGSIKEAVKNNLLSPDEIGKALSLGEGVSYWLEQLGNYALTVALEGERIPGYKLIEKQSPSSFTDETAVAIEKLGFDPYQAPKFKSKKALEEEMSPKVFKNEILPLMAPGEFKPALVSIEKKGEEKSPEYFKNKTTN